MKYNCQALESLNAEIFSVNSTRLKEIVTT